MNLSHYFNILREAQSHNATLVVVTKNQKLEDILSLYDAGHRIFGENRVQQLIEKKEQLPADIQWHMIGSLQKNKVKYLAPWISMIHSVDSFGLAEAINREALKSNRIIPILLEVKISSEESKHGFQNEELMSSLQNDSWNALTHCSVSGLMGMASFTDNSQQIQAEFRRLRQLLQSIQAQLKGKNSFIHLSMGMSGDYKIALAEGSTIIRVGSSIFAT